MEMGDKRFYKGRYRPRPRKIDDQLGRLILSGLKELTPEKEKELMAEALGLEQLHFSVKIKLFDDKEDKLLGFADVVINKSYALKGITIRKSSHGLFASEPSKKGKDGDLDPKTGKQMYFKHYNPITKEAYHAFQSAILAAYDAEKAKQNGDVKGDAQETEEIPF